MLNDRQKRIAKQVRRMFEEGFLVLDTETTGLGYGSQPVQVAISDHCGNVLLDTLCKPTVPIEEGAAAIHGIHAEHLGLAPNWKEIHPTFARIVSETKTLVIYNASYDLKILGAAFKAFDIIYKLPCAVECAMLLYAEYYGESGRFAGEYRWQKLERACYQQGVKVDGAVLHSAKGDVLATLGLLKAIAEANDG